MITERTLRNWRAQALDLKERENYLDSPDKIWKPVLQEMCNRVLRLTMELMDIQLKEKIRSKK